MADLNNIRNFSIIAHIDHGKSTLADRFLELTGTVPQNKMKEQFLDMMDLEREKGITIKMQPVRMSYTFRPEADQSLAGNSAPYTLNLIDTPGHVDFSYEVSRSMAAVEGAILLVDATKGIQAQTLANLDLARKQNITIIPVINKIDSPLAKVEETKLELADLLKISQEDILSISAKKGMGVKKLLETVIRKIPPPLQSDVNKPLRALIFDSKYDSFKGVFVYVKIVDGTVKVDDKIFLMQAEAEGKVKEVGFLKPEMTPCQELKAGEIGYIATGVKDIDKVRVGETITGFEFSLPNAPVKVEPLHGYKEVSPMVFASVYPENPDDFENLKFSLSKLKLNDASFIFELEKKEGLGRGFRCGFLGSLHAEIICERLFREFGLKLVISTPSVVYKIIKNDDKELLIFSPSYWPESKTIKETDEPCVMLEVMTPSNYVGQVFEVLETLEGRQITSDYIGKDKVILKYEVPLRKIIAGFYDSLKGATQGYASMNYALMGYRKGDLVKLDILVAGAKEDVFTKIVSGKEAEREGRKIILKLKEIMPPQLFAVSLQAVISGKIIARENISSRGKDVIAPLYGGDYSRKKKLLEKQKKGKKELKAKGQVRIPSDVYLKIFRA